MVLPTFPSAPGKLSALPPKQQASAAFSLYQGMAGYAGTCRREFGGLVDWINGLYAQGIIQ